LHCTATIAQGGIFSMDWLFAEAIREHLELRERNAGLQGAMPLERYRSDDSAANNALFKSESAARLGDTDELDDVRLALPTAGDSASPDALGVPWGSPRAFDWGD
jgi:phosphosulfolactate phosphohydrolase-like enzyme